MMDAGIAAVKASSIAARTRLVVSIRNPVAIFASAAAKYAIPVSRHPKPPPYLRRRKMAEQSHYEKFVDHIVSDDDSELGKTGAERDYALHWLEREIAICSRTQTRNAALVKALEAVAAAK